MPPNVFDDFVRFPEWSIRQEAATDGNCRPARTRGWLGSSVAGRADTKLQTCATRCEARRHKLPICADALANGAGTKCQNCRRKAQSLQARLDHLSERIHQLEAQLAVPSVDRAIGRAWRRVHTTGDRLTGGGLRSLARRLLSTFATKRHRLATEQDYCRHFVRFLFSRTAPFRRCCRPVIDPLSGWTASFRRCHRSSSAGLGAVHLSETDGCDVRQRRLEPDPMRIVLDLQGAQSESRFRGIGRYSLALAEAIAREANQHEIWLALSGRFPESIDPLRARFANLVPAERIRVFELPGPVAEVDLANSWRMQAAELLREKFLADLRPDIVHVSTLFEGFHNEVVASVGTLDRAIPTAVTLYDLIPMLHPAKYPLQCVGQASLPASGAIVEACGPSSGYLRIVGARGDRHLRHTAPAGLSRLARALTLGLGR